MQKSRGPASDSPDADSGRTTAVPFPAGAGTPPPSLPSGLDPIKAVVVDSVTAAATQPPPINVTDMGAVVPGIVGINQAFTPPPVNILGVSRNLKVIVAY